MACTVVGIFTMPDGSEEIRLKYDATNETIAYNFATSELLQEWIWANLSLRERGKKKGEHTEKRKKLGN
jgi:hypothetical protein